MPLSATNPGCGGVRIAYARLEDGEEKAEAVVAPADHPRGRRAERLAWLLVVAVLCVCNLAQLTAAVRSRARPAGVGDTYETGFATDIVPHIGLKSLQYTGGVDQTADGRRFLNLSGSSATYVGDPSPEIEKNWDALESSIPLVLSTQESTLKDGTRIATMYEPGQPGMYRLSLDVIHSLHCVNQLRKAVYADHYYPPARRGDFYYTHMNHCIEHIRQAIQCHSDLTPLVYEWDPETGSGAPVWTSTHTCRDFDKLLAWDKTRTGASLYNKGNGGTAGS